VSPSTPKGSFVVHDGRSTDCGRSLAFETAKVSTAAADQSFPGMQSREISLERRSSN
jgi:hypothetical protein